MHVFVIGPPIPPLLTLKRYDPALQSQMNGDYNQSISNPAQRFLRHRHQLRPLGPRRFAFTQFNKRQEYKDYLERKAYDEETARLTSEMLGSNTTSSSIEWIWDDDEYYLMPTDMGPFSGSGSNLQQFFSSILHAKLSFQATHIEFTAQRRYCNLWNVEFIMTFKQHGHMYANLVTARNPCPRDQDHHRKPPKAMTQLYIAIALLTTASLVQLLYNIVSVLIRYIRARMIGDHKIKTPFISNWVYVSLASDALNLSAAIMGLPDRKSYIAFAEE